MKKTVNLNMRIDEELKYDADLLFKKLGLNTSGAVNKFLTQCVREQQIPFTPSLNHSPSKELKKALKESDDIISGKSYAKKYDNVDDLFKDLDAK